ncbi:hypothetical protein MUK42_34507, partial [Musa troglodytarum]
IAYLLSAIENQKSATGNRKPDIIAEIDSAKADSKETLERLGSDNDRSRKGDHPPAVLQHFPHVARVGATLSLLLTRTTAVDSLPPVWRAAALACPKPSTSTQLGYTPVAVERIRSSKVAKPALKTLASLNNAKTSTVVALRDLGRGMDDRVRQEGRVPLKEVVADGTRRWFQDALKEARVGDVAMQVLVGQMHHSGYGVLKNDQKVRFLVVLWWCFSCDDLLDGMVSRDVGLIIHKIFGTVWFGPGHPVQTGPGSDRATGSDRAEPSPTEPSRAEPIRAEPSRTEPSRAERSRAGPVEPAVPGRTVHPGAKRDRTESGLSDSARPGPARRGSARFGSARLGSARSGSSRLGPARLGSARSGSARLGPRRWGVSHANNASDTVDSATPWPRHCWRAKRPSEGEGEGPPAVSVRPPPLRTLDLLSHLTVQNHLKLAW